MMSRWWTILLFLLLFPSSISIFFVQCFTPAALSSIIRNKRISITSGTTTTVQTKKGRRIRISEYHNHQQQQRYLSINPNIPSSSSSSSSSSSDNKYDISLLLIDHYDSFTYNLYDMIAQLTVKPPIVVAKDAFDRWDAEQWRDVGVDGIILSPGPGSPQEQTDFSKQAIRCNTNLPILGVCLGHQLLALEYGATVGKAPIPIHGQDHLIRVQEQQQQQPKQQQQSKHPPQLFDNLPTGFRAVRYHSLAATNLPSDELYVTATSPSDNVIQGIQHTKYPHYGVQFHPESIGTQYGMVLLENFCKIVQGNKNDKKKKKKYQTTIKEEVPSFQQESEEEEQQQQQSRSNMNQKVKRSDNNENRNRPRTRFQVLLHAIEPSSLSSSSSSSSLDDNNNNNNGNNDDNDDDDSSTVMIEPVDAFAALYGSESHAIWLDSSSAMSSGRGKLDIMAAPDSNKDILEYYYSYSDKNNETDAGNDILTQLQENLFLGSSSGIGTCHDDDNDDDDDGYYYDYPKKIPQYLSLVSNDFQTIQNVKDTNLTWPPFDYRGGYLGFLGYEVRHDTQRFLQEQEYNENHSINDRHHNDASTKNSTVPTAAFFLARKSLVYHHPSKMWYLVGLVENEETEMKGMIEWMKTTSTTLTNMSVQKSPLPEEDHQKVSSQPIETLSFVPNRQKKTYEQDIADCHEFIRLGESYELCLTNQLEAQISRPLSTWQLYKRLRLRNPAPYSSYVSWNIENPTPTTSHSGTPANKASFAICSSSPERFMSIQRKQYHPLGPITLQAEAKPIKGTCARVEPGNGVYLTQSERREDERRARSLEISLKNRAENLMIVDLLRNDMSRVCKIGSVHVAKLMAIESFATVHQMVSTIRGTMSDGSTSVDLLRASFPGGSMTGAPKIRTMELLEDLEENVDRGPYAGSLGYLSVNGCMDMNIIIRSAVVTPSDDGGRKITIGAGGAITALSETQDEYDEMLLKARAVVQAVQEWAASTSNSTLVDDQIPIAEVSKTKTSTKIKER